MKEPKFERRHYRALAQVMRESHPPANHPISRAWWNIYKTRMGDMLAMDNPRFDRGRFEEACEP